ncbi:MAG: cbb3-type cytochrome c oxidase subunit I, partial [Rickettsiales bacterium]|nr:cbb3-type cytochrome c oxidase subunit I [Rickettsiales bacterium]
APLMNNYVPIYHSPAFLVGLLLFLLGISSETLRFLLHFQRFTRVLDIPGLRTGLAASALMITLAFLLIFLSYRELQLVRYLFEPEDYYELLFWSGGHILQYAYTQTMLVAWLIMYRALGFKQPVPGSVMPILFSLHLLITLPALYVQWRMPILEQPFHQLFTDHMRYGGGVIPIIVGVILLVGALRQRKMPIQYTPVKMALISSVVLFAAGGLLGWRIEAIDATVPAHYHGSIVGITLALMGAAYALLPALGKASPSGKLATLQPLLYGGGQLLHIAGLAWSGGYGALRKTPGAMQSLEGQTAMGLMGLGGLLSVLGGLFFVIIMIRCLTSQRKV